MSSAPASPVPPSPASSLPGKPASGISERNGSALGLLLAAPPSGNERSQPVSWYHQQKSTGLVMQLAPFVPHTGSPSEPRVDCTRPVSTPQPKLLKSGCPGPPNGGDVVFL